MSWPGTWQSWDHTTERLPSVSNHPKENLWVGEARGGRGPGRSASDICLGVGAAAAGARSILLPEPPLQVCGEPSWSPTLSAD